MSKMPVPSVPGNLGYYRFPCLYRDTLIFTAEGDLWKMDLSQQIAHRLTTHHGLEQFAQISPDGQWVAFTGQYDGFSEVYLIPLQGGVPRRLTYVGYAKVLGWTDENHILFTTRYYSLLGDRQLAMVNAQTLKVDLLPLSQASEGYYDTDRTLYFTRLPFQGSHTKRYHGGSVETLWKFPEGAEEAIPLTADYTGTSKTPILHKNRIYFLSDRDGTMNIWSMTKNGKGLRQHTHSSGWDLKGLSNWEGKFVYQKGADLYAWEIGKKKEQKIEIFLSSDFDQKRKKWIRNPITRVSSLDISPSGKQLAFTTRGRIFVAPTSQGRLIEITRKQGVRYRRAKFVDEKTLSFFSDESGEVELWDSPTDKPDVHHQLTDNHKSLMMYQSLDPKGNWIAYANKDWELWVYSRTSKVKLLVDTSPHGGLYSHRWSPDGRWLCYVKEGENTHSYLVIYNPSNQKKHIITTQRLDSYMPRWSPDGKWLYFVSDREFDPIVKHPWGPRQPGPFYDRTAKMYALALRKGLRFPFQEGDELHHNRIEKKPKKNGEKAPRISVEIDFEGLMGRLYEVPVEPSNFLSLEVSNEYLFWMEHPAKDAPERSLYALKIGNNPNMNPVKLASDIHYFLLARGKKKLLVKTGRSVHVFEADGKAPNLSKTQVPLSRWQFEIDPTEEWRQMFIEAWRLERDYFYDRNLHGLDWDAQLVKHLPLVDRIADRYELDDLLAHMVSELSALHIYVYGGDKRMGSEANFPGFLGVKLEKEEEGSGFSIKHIYESDPDYPDELGPLAKPGLNVNIGDIICSVDGVSTEQAHHIGELLLHKAHKQVRLTLQDSEDASRERDIIIKPFSYWEERELKYREWMYTRRKLVESQSNARIGYVHLSAMGGENYTEWIRQFYPVFHLPGLILDVRNNGGGNIGSWILEKLLRKAWAFFQPRVGKAYWGMQYAFRGHMVVICDENTASNGESFAEGFRRMGLGKVIGRRSWGGNIWLTSSNLLVDRGIATAAEIGVYSPEGEWLIEGHGVEPDIEVDNFPHESFMGKDRQLEAAISHILALIKEDPRTVPPPPPYPNKRFAYKGEK